MTFFGGGGGWGTGFRSQARDEDFTVNESLAQVNESPLAVNYPPGAVNDPLEP
jgi:hypothetical protein